MVILISFMPNLRSISGKLTLHLHAQPLVPRLDRSDYSGMRSFIAYKLLIPWVLRDFDNEC
jgi:hypothetical protein